MAALRNGNGSGRSELSAMEDKDLTCQRYCCADVYKTGVESITDENDRTYTTEKLGKANITTSATSQQMVRSKRRPM